MIEQSLGGSSPQQKSQQSAALRLPRDVWAAVFQYLPLNDRCSCAAMCHEWAAVVHRPPLVVEVDAGTGTIKLISGANPEGAAAKAGWHAMIVSAPAHRLHLRLTGTTTRLMPASQGGAAPGVALCAALADLGRTKGWTSLVLDSLSSRWLQQQNRLGAVRSFGSLRQLQMCQVYADEALTALLQQLTGLQGLALSMVRCGRRRFDDQWNLIGKHLNLRTLRLDCTGCNLLPKQLKGGLHGSKARCKVEAMVLIHTGCSDASFCFGRGDMPLLRTLVIEEPDLPSSRDKPLEVYLAPRPSFTFATASSLLDDDEPSARPAPERALRIAGPRSHAGNTLNVQGAALWDGSKPDTERLLLLGKWDPAARGKALRLRGRSAVAVRWEDAAGFAHMELESACHMMDELAATVLKGLLGTLADTDARKQTPTTHTEALTLRWPALMPALSWRLRQPAGLLPSLRTLDLSHNNLKELPECPQLWPRLVALDLSHNSLGGAVPEAALASMTALQMLDMSFQADWSMASAALLLLAASKLPKLQVLGLRHRGTLPALQPHPAADGDAGAAGFWAARHRLHCRVVDQEAARMPPAHPPVEVPLIG